MITNAWSFERLGGPDVLELSPHEMKEPDPGEVLVAREALTSMATNQHLGKLVIRGES